MKSFYPKERSYAIDYPVAGTASSFDLGDMTESLAAKTKSVLFFIY